MKNIEKLRLFIKTKGIVFFIFFLAVIIFTPAIARNLLFRLSPIFPFIHLVNDKLFLLTIQYFSFLILFIILYKFSKKLVNFISKEYWYYSFGKALVPAFIAFGFGFFVTFIIIYLSDVLPLPVQIKDWIKLPNQGYIEIFEEINNKNNFKIILWFIYIVVFAPIIEEILFRGFLQESIGKIFGRFNIDLIIVALIFSLFHITSLSNAIFSFIVGYFLSKQKKVSGSINRSVFIHGLINCTGLLYGIAVHYSKF